MVVQNHGKSSMRYVESFGESRRRTTSGFLNGVADTPPVPSIAAL